MAIHTDVTDLSKLNEKLRNPLYWGVFLVVMLTMTQTVLSYYKEGERTNLGGPVRVTETSLLSQGTLFVQPSIEGRMIIEEDFKAGYVLINKAETLSDDNPLKPILAQKDNVLIYTVQKGDTLETLAENFGISEETLVWANKKSEGATLRAGEEIVILPVSGVVHKVKEGETIEKIAEIYEVDPEEINRNNLKIEAGVSIVIPEATPKSNYVAPVSYKPNLAGYFKMPTSGFNWGYLHNYNAVDIANACGTAVYASADGVVVEESSTGWNGGYGTYIIIEHPNGTKTLYAHNSENLVAVGDMVKQGELIGYIGRTGNVTGVSGCHLHFEVHGAINPFANQ